MKCKLIRTIFISVLLRNFRYTSDASKLNASKKFSLMAKACKESSNFVVPLTDGNFTKFVLDTPRSYYLVLLFNAISPAYKCQHCATVKPRFEKLSYSYHTRYDIQTESHPVFWGIIDIDQGRKSFTSVNIQSAPHVYVLPPDVAFNVNEEFPASHSSGSHLLIQKSPEAFAVYFSATTGIDLVVLHDMRYLQVLACLFAVIVAIMAHFVIPQPFILRSLLHSRALWFVICMLVYSIGISGIIYCIIRNPQAFSSVQNSNGTSNVKLFSNGREQWQWEGVVICILYIVMALSIFLIMFLTKFQCTYPLVSNVLTCVVIAVLLFCSKEFFSLYQIKTPWYIFQDILPDSVKWMLYQGTIKRSSGLIARLIRLSDIWLHEFSGVEMFCKKFKALLVDYLARTVKNKLGIVS